MDDFVLVTFEGTYGGTYYVPANQVRYLSKDGLFNTSSSTIYLYKDVLSDSQQAYISIPAYSYPRRYTNNNYTYITNASNVRFNGYGEFLRSYDLVEVMLLTLISSVCLIRLIFRRGR